MTIHGPSTIVEIGRIYGYIHVFKELRNSGAESEMEVICITLLIILTFEFSLGHFDTVTCDFDMGHISNAQGSIGQLVER